jgi:hypothetical protein
MQSGRVLSHCFEKLEKKMRLKRFRFSSTAVALILFCFAATDVFPATVKGQVTDSEGAAIKGAHVLFHLDPSGRAKPATSVDAVRETSVAGYFEVQLDPGFYDVCVMATAFTPECGKILVSKQGDVGHDVRLNADPLVIKHLGDRF